MTNKEKAAQINEEAVNDHWNIFEKARTHLKDGIDIHAVVETILDRLDALYEFDFDVRCILAEIVFEGLPV